MTYHTEAIAPFEPAVLEEPTFDVVVIGGGGGNSTMTGGLVEVLQNGAADNQGDLGYGGYDTQALNGGGERVSVTAVTGIGDDGSMTGVAKKFFNAAAMGDLTKIHNQVRGNEAGGEPLYGRFDEGDGVEVLVDRGAEIQRIALADLRSRTDSPLTQHRTGLRIAQTMDEAADLADRLAFATGEDLRGHKMGTFVLTALTRMHEGDVVAASLELGSWTQAYADVLASTSTPHEVHLLDDGDRIIGEGVIDDYVVRDPHNATIELVPTTPGGEVEIHQVTYDRIANADLIIHAPGSPFASRRAINATPGMTDAFLEQADRGGMMVGVANLVEEHNATPGLRGSDYLDIDEKGTVRPYDVFFYNSNTQAVPEGKVPLKFDPAEFTQRQARAIAAELIDMSFIQAYDSRDPIAHLRSPVHHNVQALVAIMTSEGLLPQVVPVNA